MILLYWCVIFCFLILLQVRIGDGGWETWYDDGGFRGGFIDDGISSRLDNEPIDEIKGILDDFLVWNETGLITNYEFIFKNYW